MNNDNNIIFCSRCGAEMKADARYCMKCGNLNADHAENKNMQQYVKNQTNTYQIGQGAVRTEEKAGDVVSNNKNSNRLGCYIFNLIVFFLVILVETGLIYSYYDGFNKSMLSLWSTITLGISFLFIMSLSLQIVYIKANKPWWLVFVPIVNYFMYFAIAYEKWVVGLYFLIGFVAVGILAFINQTTSIIALVLAIVLIIYFLKIQGSFADHFGHKPFFYMFFPVIMLPVIAFDGSVYKGIIYSDKKLTIEKDFMFKKIILFCYLLFFFGGLGLTLYLRKADFPKYVENMKKRYYVYAAEQVSYEVENRVSKKQISCEKTSFSSDNGTYYFYYPDVGRKIFLIFSKSREAITANVKVVIENGEAKYYIALTDGVYGFEETLYEDINVDTVTYKRDLEFKPYLNDNYCEITYGS